MSYCKKSADSDLYVYCDGGFYHCCGCELTPSPECCELSTLEELRDHLWAHRSAGHLVPQRAIDRVERELAKVADFIHSWPDEWRKDTPVLFVRKLHELDLSVEQIADVLKAVDTTCHECWDWKSGCQCWNDE